MDFPKFDDLNLSKIFICIGMSVTGLKNKSINLKCQKLLCVEIKFYQHQLRNLQDNSFFVENLYFQVEALDFRIALVFLS